MVAVDRKELDDDLERITFRQPNLRGNSGGEYMYPFTVVSLRPTDWASNSPS
jgi:hypothetical protein